MNSKVAPAKTDVLADLLRIFTLEQLEMLRDECEEMLDYGYGAVAVEFDHHHPNKIIPSRYKVLPKPASYRPE